MELVLRTLKRSEWRSLPGTLLSFSHRLKKLLRPSAFLLATLLFAAGFRPVLLGGLLHHLVLLSGGGVPDF
jgi:hypothetical protein